MSKANSIERIDIETNGKTIVLIPYDAYMAAFVFLQCGRTEEEVLPLLGVNKEEWGKLHKAYRWFHADMGEWEKDAYLDPLKEDEVVDHILKPRWHIQRKDGEKITLRVTSSIRDKTLRNPYIGPFKDLDWAAHYVATHPDASLFHYFHDGNTVYFRGQPLLQKDGSRLPVDASSFEWVGGRWLRDKNHIYGQGELNGRRVRVYWYIVEGADAPSFRMVNLHYAKDCNAAYYITGKTLKTKSPDAFHVLPDIRLNNHHFTCDFLIENSRYARDREKVYHFGSIIRKADAKSFRLLGHEYATDGKIVWYMDRRERIEGADAASFRVLGPTEPFESQGNIDSLDCFRPYYRGEPVDPTSAHEALRNFFAHYKDLDGWWWHRQEARLHPKA